MRALTRFVGSGIGHAVEVGCVEGRISRELKTLGYRVTATGAVAALVEASWQANSADEYAVADGKDLVTGIAFDRVASRNAASGYPQDARSRTIQGDVRVRIQVENGEMLDVTVESSVPVLAAYSSRWLRWHWQFRPSVSGVYLLPISYKLTA